MKQHQRAAQLAQTLEDGRDTLREREQQRELTQSLLNEANRALTDLKSQLSGKSARLEQIRTRNERLTAESGELQLQVEQINEEMEMARQRLHEALGRMDELARQRDELTRRRDDLRDALERVRQQARTDRDNAHGLHVASRPCVPNWNPPARGWSAWMHSCCNWPSAAKSCA